MPFWNFRAAYALPQIGICTVGEPALEWWHKGGHPERKSMLISGSHTRSINCSPHFSIAIASDGTLLATKAKGIYKPAWTDCARSVRQVLGGSYPRPGSRSPPGRHLVLPLLSGANRPDGVPVGVMCQVSGKPNVRCRVLGWPSLLAGTPGISPLKVSPRMAIRRRKRLRRRWPALLRRSSRRPTSTPGTSLTPVTRRSRRSSDARGSPSSAVRCFSLRRPMRRYGLRCP